MNKFHSILRFRVRFYFSKIKFLQNMINNISDNKQIEGFGQSVGLGLDIIFHLGLRSIL